MENTDSLWSTQKLVPMIRNKQGMTCNIAHLVRCSRVLSYRLEIDRYVPVTIPLGY